MGLNKKQLIPLLREALKEDVGRGDLTSLYLIEKETVGQAVLIARQPGILCGLRIFLWVFQCVDPEIKIKFLKKDGEHVRPGERIARLHGRVRTILTPERTALNFLQRLSGIATFTRTFVDAARSYPLKIFDTRKTTPLWRTLEKYAVRVGGGHNHRFGLHDMIMIKDNHIDALGSVAEAISRAKRRNRGRLKIACEVRSLNELRLVLKEGVDLIMLDNMPLHRIKKALAIADAHLEIEVSGGITPKRAGQLAKLGVRRISVGALTHSAPALDFTLKIIPPKHTKGKTS